ncbi:MAG: hypothetical protein ACJ76S_04320 [Solirubrobacteraceae bacterium]|jgi:hypothetical protein
MPSTQDFYDRLGQTNGLLQQVDTDVKSVKTSVETVNTTLQSGFAQLNNTLQAGFTELITLGKYTNQALYQNSQQNDTIICILEHISQHTCAILNEAAAQTKLQEKIEHSTVALEELYEATHAEAALQREREGALRAQIEECCPPPPPEPPCTYEPCRAPRRLPAPPKVGRDDIR